MSRTNLRRILAIAVCVLALAAHAEAAFRFYLVPIVGVGTKVDPRRPKYFFSDAAGTGIVGIVPAGWSAMRYGREPWMIVGADLSASDHTTVNGMADVVAFPVDLSTTLTSGQATTVQNALESAKVPGEWVAAGQTWRSVLRTVLSLFFVMQRFGALAVDSLFKTATLNSTVGSLSAGELTNLQKSADDLNLSRAAITGSTTIRAALKVLADQINAGAFTFNGVAP